MNLRLIINPGSVGQPRDRDHRAAYVMLDTDARTLTQFRVEYDMETAQKHFADAGLPPSLAERLAYGL